MNDCTTQRCARPAWLAELKPFEAASTGKAVRQLVNTVLPYAGLWAAMIVGLQQGAPYWAILPLQVVAALFLVRIFILFHDCCHGSFFPASWANRTVGFLAGVLTFTSSAQFRFSHGVHHSSAGNLDRRGIGDVWTMTLEEYLSSLPRRRLKYRAYRHPLVLFVLGPIYSFLYSSRVPRPGSSTSRTLNVIGTDLGIIVVGVALSLVFGWRVYLTIQLPVLFVAGAVGIWLFYVQHQFDPSYWRREASWEYVDAALEGSSYYRLPRLLQWLSGNIGLHHVHHLRPRIPNYNLQACLDAIPILRLTNPLTLGRSLASVRLNLWDEARGRLVAFREARRRLAAT